MSEELKKEWEREFDILFDNALDAEDWLLQEETENKLKSFISSLLAKQQEEISQRITEQYKQNPPYLDASSWWNYGLKMTFAQYFLEKQQEDAIANYQTNYEQKHIVSAIELAREEFVKKVEDWKKIPPLTEYQTSYNEALDDLLADIKSKLK